MAETLTEVDQFTATIQMPTSGEANSAADLRDKAIQRLTDRTRYLKNRYDETDWCLFTYSGSATLGGAFTPVIISQSAGFAVSGTTVTAPVGTYECHLCFYGYSNNSADESLELGSTLSTGSGAACSARAVRYRAASGDGNRASVSSFGVAIVASGQSFQVTSLALLGSTTTAESTSNNLSRVLVKRIRPTE